MPTFVIILFLVILIALVGFLIFLFLKNLGSNKSDEKLLDILSSDGMLIKRPIAYDGKNVVIGFKVDEWKEKLL